MAHETTHDHHHAAADKTPAVPFRSAFWFVVILAGLFVAAVNFTNVMGSDEGHGAHGAATGHEAVHEGHDEHGGGATNAPMEATSNQTLHGETGLGKPVEDSAAHQEGGHVGNGHPETH